MHYQQFKLNHIMSKKFLFAALLFATSCSTSSDVFSVKDGFAVIEAEKFHSQTLDDIRAWYIIDQTSVAEGLIPMLYEGASEGKYIQILPDTRVTHDDELIFDENFCGEAGVQAVVSYNVDFEEAGRYYIWVSCYSSGSEDNGVHVGLDGQWPESGKRMQWCPHKNEWTWESRQRTDEVHCGVPGQIWLDVETPGIHTISFSMREDGFAMDRFAISKEWDISPKADIVGRVYIEEMK